MRGIRNTLLAAATMIGGLAYAGASEEQTAEANNPLANMVAVNLQNFYVPALSGGKTTFNSSLVRIVTPFSRVLPRFTLPINTISNPETGEVVSGLGDLNVFVTIILTGDKSPVSIGIGPLYQAPTATSPGLGAGVHQLGAAFIMVYQTGPLLFGTLLTWQHSVAADVADRTNLGVLQPVTILQIGGGTYLRSAPTWIFDFEKNAYNLPLGVGIGQVAVVNKAVLNFFIEPQFSIYNNGPSTPIFQLFGGINIQFMTGGKKKKKSKEQEEAAIRRSLLPQNNQSAASFTF